MTDTTTKTPEYWMENIGKSDIPVPRLCELWGEDEISHDRVKEIVAKVGVELRYYFVEMPEGMIDHDDALDAEYLAQAERPTWHGTDGWKLIGAWDTEDGEIVLMYGRPLAQEAAGA